MSGGESNAKGQEHETRPKGSEEPSGKDLGALRRGGYSPGAEQKMPSSKINYIKSYLTCYLFTVLISSYMIILTAIDCDSHAQYRPSP